MTELEDLAKRICDVLDDGCNLLAGSAMHLMLKAALAVSLTAGQSAAKQGYTYCAERAKPGGCPLPNVQCGWPECNTPPKTHRAPYEIPR